jgi:hypothetical protein
MSAIQQIVLGAVGRKLNILGENFIFSENNIFSPSITYEPDNNKVLIAYADAGNSSYGTILVGTVVEDNISFGSPIIFNSSGTNYISTSYDTYNNRVLIAYADTSSNAGLIRYGTVSGNSMSLGPAITFKTERAYNINICYNKTNNRFVIAYRDVAMSDYGKAITGYFSGSSYYFGNEVIFSSMYSYGFSTTHDEFNNKMVIAYRSYGTSSYGKAIVGTISGNSVSFGNFTTINNETPTRLSSIYDPINKKVLIFYNNYGASYNGGVVIGNVSGDTISFGSSYMFTNNNNLYNISSSYSTNNNKFIVVYLHNTVNTNFVTCSIINGSFTFDSTINITNSSAHGHNNVAYDPINNKFIIAYREGDGNTVDYKGVINLINT